MQLRAIYYDDKYTNYFAFVDFPANNKDALDNPFDLSELKKEIESTFEITLHFLSHQVTDGFLLSR